MWSWAFFHETIFSSGIDSAFQTVLQQNIADPEAKPENSSDLYTIYRKMKENKVPPLL